MWCKDKDFNSFAVDFTKLLTDGFWGAGHQLFEDGVKSKAVWAKRVLLI